MLEKLVDFYDAQDGQERVLHAHSIDAAVGIEAAKAGGFRSVGLGPRERIGGADVIFPSLAGVRLSDLLAALTPGQRSPSAATAQPGRCGGRLC